MMNSKQSQKAGDNSSLIQGNTINIYQGITEDRAKEIVKEQIPDVISSFTVEAGVIAEERLVHFSEVLIPKLIKENLLESLRDPSIQFLLREAQKTAASTERTDDYSLLSELLVHRMKNNDRIVCSGVNHAISIIDEISDEALLGLTVIHSVSYLTPSSGFIKDGLQALNKYYSSIISGDLPKGNLWLDQLDVLNAVRIASFGSLRKLEDYYFEQLPGYLDVGIQKESAQHAKCIRLLNDAGLPSNIIVEHELNPDFLRLPIVNYGQIDKLLITRNEIRIIDGQYVSVPTSTPINDCQKKAIQEVYALYETDVTLKENNRKTLISLWDSYPNLNVLRKWWNAISHSVELTCVGRVLANANAQRCDPSIPNIVQ